MADSPAEALSCDIKNGCNFFYLRSDFQNKMLTCDLGPFCMSAKIYRTCFQEEASSAKFAHM